MLIFAKIVFLCAAVLAIACVCVAKRGHLEWLHRRFVALSWFHKVVVMLFLCVWIVRAQKGGGGDDDGESGNYSLLASSVRAYAPWTWRGAADDWFILDFPDGWLFPHGSNHWTRCVVLTSGEIWETTRGVNRIVAVGRQMSAVPDESVFTYGLTESNSYLMVWDNFFLNRDTNQPITASIELFRNGDWIVSTNGISEHHEMPWPYGATSALPSSADIAEVNAGQFLLHAAFPSNLEERVALTVTTGANSVRYRVAEGGDYSFPLDKGREYEIDASWDDGIEFAWSDTVSNENDSVVFWRERGGSKWHLQWRPQIQLTPESVAVAEDGSASAELFAFLPLNDSAEYSWASPLGTARLSDPSSQNTRLINANGASRIDVVAETDYYSVTGSVPIVYCVTNSPATNDWTLGYVSFSASVPPVMNIARQANNALTPVTLSFSSPCPTNGTLHFSLSNGRLYAASNRTQQVDLSCDWRLDGASGFSRTFYLECDAHSSGVGSELVQLEWTDGDHEGHDHLTSETSFTVVELRNEPITTMAKTVDGRRHIVNPCCAVAGAEAYFAVDMLPHDIPDESIVWRCSGGQLTFANNGTGREMTVVVSAGGGLPVEIEIDHIDGLPNKMHFNVEPVEMNTVTIYPCEIVKPNSAAVITRERVEQMLVGVNDIFRQVGLQFVSDDVVVVTNKNWTENGLVNRQAGSAIRNIMHSTGGLEVYFIDGVIQKQLNGNIKRKEPLGSHTSAGIIVKKIADYFVLAHEIGHACGWADIYDERGKEGRVSIVLTDEENVLMEERLPGDWGFYSEGCTQRHIIRRLLMRGVRGVNQCDIPSSGVFGIGKDSLNGGYQKNVMNTGKSGMLTSSPHSN